MRIIRSKKLWASAAATGAAGALGLALVAPAAPAEEAQGGTPTIAMVQDGNQLSFEGPDNINPGENLRIVNQTDPQQIGPHTFSLTQEDIIPKTIGQFKACAKAEPGTACRKVFKAHEVNFEKEEIGKKVVDFGKSGWNLMFREQGHQGDSWVALKEGAEYTAEVSARPGKTLTYFCAIHPDMQGEIQVNSPVKCRSPATRAVFLAAGSSLEPLRARPRWHCRRGCARSAGPLSRVPSRSSLSSAAFPSPSS